MFDLLCFIVPTMLVSALFSFGLKSYSPFVPQSISLQINPLFFMYPAAVASSFAFMLPVATAPNAIVFASGNVRVIDMVSSRLL